ncbi:MAG: acyl-CoA dehydrogenase family protein, partial [Gammaproteobacteria bacterium]|nr:acyl-CoA dehydrogenase family protein [Gammaproteobacteria bacterium]
MDFSYSPKTRELLQKLTTFRDEHIIPNEEVFTRQVNEGERWAAVPVIEELKILAREQGLWNLFLPEPEYGAGLSNLEYAPLAEVMGCNEWAPEVFNCNAPDTGNMEVLARYGNDAQKEQWLTPLLEGEIRS